MSVNENGLTDEQVIERHATGRGNIIEQRSSRTVASILRENIFTLFNGILTACFITVLLIGDLRDGFFFTIVVVNAAIGIIQELRAKRELDHLALVAAPHSLVRRNGETQTVTMTDIVQDDVIVLRPGDQLPVDAAVLEGDGLLLDESLLTGESDPLPKMIGDDLLSGSYVSAGAGLARATAVGADSYVNKLTSEIKRYSLVHSELRAAVNRILVWISWLLAPLLLIIVGGRIFAYGGWNELVRTNRFQAAIVDAVASVIGMIPEGLVLLTSLAFGVAALQLARRRVLVQELAAVEVLARVDVLCLDKTGTLTTGEFELDRLDVFDDAYKNSCADALAHFGSDDSANATARTLGKEFPHIRGTVVARLPFSSTVKYAGVTIDYGDRQETWLLGAPEWLFSKHPVYRETSDELAKQGLRTLAVARMDGSLPAAGTSAERLQLTPVALLALRESLRPEARQTLQFFDEQGVRVIILSGDNPLTVSALVRTLGLNVEAVDASTLQAESEFDDALTYASAFGRIRPEQKRDAIRILQKQGHIVAMTGDGVNDAMAIKTADLGIAMGNATGATKSVSRLVLLDNRFDRLPHVVALGRRVIANIERVSNIFLSKTAYGVLLAMVTAATFAPFPFLPRQLSLVSTFAIGIPSFFLALAPNALRYRPGILRRITLFSIPSGIIIVVACVFAFTVVRAMVPLVEARSITTVTLFLVSLWLLSVLARPFTIVRWGLLCGMAAVFAAVCLTPSIADFFSMKLMWNVPLLVGSCFGIVGAVCIEGWYRVARHRQLVFDRMVTGVTPTR